MMLARRLSPSALSSLLYIYLRLRPNDAQGVWSNVLSAVSQLYGSSEQVLDQKTALAFLAYLASDTRFSTVLGTIATSDLSKVAAGICEDALSPLGDAAGSSQILVLLLQRKGKLLFTPICLS